MKQFDIEISYRRIDSSEVWFTTIECEENRKPVDDTHHSQHILTIVRLIFSFFLLLTLLNTA